MAEQEPATVSRPAALDPAAGHWSRGRRVAAGANVAVFRVNAESGRLAFTGQFVPVGNPSVIRFSTLKAAGEIAAILPGWSGIQHNPGQTEENEFPAVFIVLPPIILPLRATANRGKIMGAG